MPDHNQSERMPPHQPRTPEQHAAVRRRALPVGVAAAVLGAVGILLLLRVEVAPGVPPNLMAVNMGMCAVLMGVGILFYARGTPGTRAAAASSLAAVLLGLAGTVLFTVQSVNWHKKIEDQDIKQVAAIVGAAEKYAREHNGEYPAGLEVLLTEKYLEGRTLMSPFGGEGSAYLVKNAVDLADVKVVAQHADYTYEGSGLRIGMPEDMRRSLIVVYETYPVMRTRCTTGYADGRVEFLTQEEFAAAGQASDKARGKAATKP